MFEIGWYLRVSGIAPTVVQDWTATPTAQFSVDFCPMALFLAHRRNSQLAVDSRLK